MASLTDDGGLTSFPLLCPVRGMWFSTGSRGSQMRRIPRLLNDRPYNKIDSKIKAISGIIIKMRNQMCCGRDRDFIPHNINNKNRNYIHNNVVHYMDLYSNLITVFVAIHCLQLSVGLSALCVCLRFFPTKWTRAATHLLIANAYIRGLHIKIDIIMVKIALDTLCVDLIEKIEASARRNVPLREKCSHWNTWWLVYYYGYAAIRNCRILRQFVTFSCLFFFLSFVASYKFTHTVLYVCCVIVIWFITHTLFVIRRVYDVWVSHLDIHEV